MQTFQQVETVLASYASDQQTLLAATHPEFAACTDMQLKAIALKRLQVQTVLSVEEMSSNLWDYSSD